MSVTPTSASSGWYVKLPSDSIVIVPPSVVGAFVTGSATRLACGVSGSVSLESTEPVISLPACDAGRVVPTNRPVLPIASNESATAVGASATAVTAIARVAAGPAPPVSEATNSTVLEVVGTSPEWL